MTSTITRMERIQELRRKRDKLRDNGGDPHAIAKLDAEIKRLTAEFKKHMEKHK